MLQYNTAREILEKRGAPDRQRCMIHLRTSFRVSKSTGATPCPFDIYHSRVTCVLHSPCLSVACWPSHLTSFAVPPGQNHAQPEHTPKSSKGLNGMSFLSCESPSRRPHKVVAGKRLSTTGVFDSDLAPGLPDKSAARVAMARALRCRHHHDCRTHSHAQWVVGRRGDHMCLTRRVQVPI